jgi:signal transduction histidine kinase
MLFFIFLTWLIEPAKFSNVIIVILLFTLFIFLVGYVVTFIKQRRQIEAFNRWFEQRDRASEQVVLSVLDKSLDAAFERVINELNRQEQMKKEAQVALQNYQDFIEAWTHEIKTPLSVATLVLKNHQAAMSPYVYNRIQHVRVTIANDVDRILYYARMQTDHPDYKFSELDLAACIEASLETFNTIVLEREINVQVTLKRVKIVSDEKVLLFMLTQIFSNAFKYVAPVDGLMTVDLLQATNKCMKLVIWNNGPSVPLEDVPFLFDKGFTGMHPKRADATGIGLYLVKKYGEMLSIDVRVQEVASAGSGFGLELIFPVV